MAHADVEKRNMPEVAAFEAFVDEVQRRYGVSRIDALKRAAHEYPRDAFAKYRHALSDE